MDSRLDADSPVSSRSLDNLLDLSSNGLSLKAQERAKEVQRTEMDASKEKKDAYEPR